jgi:hypothetical protein
MTKKNPHAVALNRDDLDADAKARSAALLGVRGGSVSSDAKAAAARRNGKKGGRPRKSKRRQS